MTLGETPLFGGVGNPPKGGSLGNPPQIKGGQILRPRFGNQKPGLRISPIPADIIHTKGKRAKKFPFKRVIGNNSP